MIRIMSFFVLFAFAGLFAANSGNNPEEGKKLFTDAKCQNCHSIESQNIEAKTKKKDTPDLSNTGAKHDADFFMSYLTKKEAMGDKKHPVAFKGSDEDLKKLAEWLDSLEKKK
jgi:cytochrome c553